MAKDAIILFSGGIDSTACLFFYKSLGYNVEPIFIDYGQKSAYKEFAAAAAISSRYHFQLKKIKTNIRIDESKPEILGRNAFFITTALLLAKDHTSMIALGIHSGTNYIDCSLQFIDKMQEIVDLYATQKILRLGVPFIDWTKSDVFNYCLINKIPLELTYSCELGLDQPCGKCLSCLDLKKLYGEKATTL